MSATKRYEEELRKTYEVPNWGPLLKILMGARGKKAPERPNQKSTLAQRVPQPPPKLRRGIKPAPRSKSAPLPPAPALPGGRRPDTTGAITSLRRSLDRYHAYPLVRANLFARSNCLRSVRLYARKLRALDGVDQDALAIFLEHVNTRIDFLDKLNSYTRNDLIKINNLMEVVREQKEREKSMQPGENLTVGLHWARILEKLDPYHRAMPGNRDIFDKFNAWAASNWDDRLMPAHNLVDYFLSDTFTKRHDAVVPYFDKVTRRFSKLVFLPSKQMVYAYYVRHVDENKVKYDRCTATDLKRGLIPHQKPFHTIGGNVVLGNEKIQYGGLAYRDEGLDLFGAQIYVMHNDVFYTYKAQGAKHSMALAGEAVQSAGMIVGDKGKILAIDNKSGHYRPSWKHLRQAVEALHLKQVFDLEACVGVSYGDGCAFFTVKDFRDLAGRSFPMQATLDAINRGYDHVFKKQRFRRVRRAYENTILSGHRTWSWEAAKEEFLDVLYPKARKHRQALESLSRRHRAWYASEFRQASAVWYKKRKGRFKTIDQMLAAFDKAHADYAAIWNSFDPKIKEFRVVVKALDQAYQDLGQAVQDWLEHNKWSEGKRADAVRKLEQQMEKDAESIRHVKEWIEDMAKRDLGQGYTAEWS